MTIMALWESVPEENNVMGITLTRRFHAVGQGLFCSEIVEGADFKHTVVYDCGTESDDYLLQSEMADISKLVKDDRIDILFLSHLHKDHISGVKRLLHDYNVSKVVLPRLTPFQIIRVYLYRTGTLPTDNERFGEEAVEIIQQVLRHRAQEDGDGTSYDEIPVFVEPVTEREQDDELINGSHNINIYSTFIKSRYTYSVLDPTGRTLVKYIPFNCEDTKSLVFNIACNHLYPSLYVDLGNGNLNQLGNTNLLAELAKLYKCIFGNLNESSMPVLSHVLSSGMNIDCLYTGDYSGKADKAVAHLRSFFNNEWGEIAYIQVPHHGSRYDNLAELYNAGKHTCVISYGKKNKYGHPHDSALKVIRNAGDNLLCITDRNQTLVKIDNIKKI